MVVSGQSLQARDAEQLLDWPFNGRSRLYIFFFHFFILVYYVPAFENAKDIRYQSTRFQHR